MKEKVNWNRMWILKEIFWVIEDRINDLMINDDRLELIDKN